MDSYKKDYHLINHYKFELIKYVKIILYAI